MHVVCICMHSSHNRKPLDEYETLSEDERERKERTARLGWCHVTTTSRTLTYLACCLLFIVSYLLLTSYFLFPASCILPVGLSAKPPSCQCSRPSRSVYQAPKIGDGLGGGRPPLLFVHSAHRGEGGNTAKLAVVLCERITEHQPRADETTKMCAGLENERM